MRAGMVHEKETCLKTTLAMQSAHVSISHEQIIRSYISTLTLSCAQARTSVCGSVQGGVWVWC